MRDMRFRLREEPVATPASDATSNVMDDNEPMFRADHEMPGPTDAAEDTESYMKIPEADPRLNRQVSVEVDWADEGTEPPNANSAFKLAKKFSCSALLVDPAGPGGGWPVVRITGGASNVRRFLKAAGYDDDLSIYQVEGTLMAAKSVKKFVTDYVYEGLDEYSKYDSEVWRSGLGDIEGPDPGDKDVARMNDLKKRAGGSEFQIINLARNMANAIKDRGKAIRRAKAARQVFPGELGKKLERIFLGMEEGKDWGNDDYCICTGDKCPNCRNKKCKVCSTVEK